MTFKEKDRVRVDSSEFGVVNGTIIAVNYGGSYKIKYDNGQIRTKYSYDLIKLTAATPVAEVIGYQVSINGAFHNRIFESEEGVKFFAEGITASGAKAKVETFKVTREPLV